MRSSTVIEEVVDDYELSNFEQFSLLPSLIRDFDKKKQAIDPIVHNMKRRKELKIGR